jgi:hypothetical protein
MQASQVRVMSRGWLYGLTAMLCILILGGALFFNFRYASTVPDRRMVFGADKVDFCIDVQAKFRDKRFDELDRMGQELASLEDRFVGGEEKVGRFYWSMAADGCTSSFCEAQPVQPANIRRIEEWLDRSPASLVAKTAMATNWYFHAWVGRGCAEFEDVTFERWQQFYDRMRTARSYLSDFDLRDSPASYVIMLDILRQTGGPRTEIDALFDEGRSAFPGMIILTAAYARAVDPSWFGEEGELEWLAESQLRGSGGDIGQIAYGVVAEQAAEYNGYQDFFTKTGLSWDKIKESFATRKRVYGLSVHDWNAYCYIALAASDREACREAYANFAPHWDPTVWQDQSVYLDRVLPWIKDQ